MSDGAFSPVPDACNRALVEIEADPLNLTATTEEHVRTCTACAETQVAWLAQEAFEVQAPPGYFDRLPGRILGKLPAAPRRRQPHFAIWAMAATFMLAVGVGGFFAGRANRQPMVEAALAPPPSVETHETLPDTPFLEGEDDYAQLPDLSPEQAHRLIERVNNPSPRP